MRNPVAGIFQKQNPAYLENGTGHIKPHAKKSPMPSPFRIIFPRETWGESFVSTGSHAACRHRMIIGTPTLTKIKAGEIFVQSYTGYDYSLESWSINLEKEGLVELYTDQFFSAICISLTNRMILHSDQDETHECLENHYRLLSLSPGTYRLKLFKGATVLFFIVPPSYHLQGLSTLEPAIFEALAKTTYHVHHPPILTEEALISYTVKRHIRLLEKINKTISAPDFELRIYMIRILSFYKAELSKSKKDKHQLSHGKEIAVSVRQYILENLGDPQIGNIRKLCQKFNVSDKTLRKEFIRLTSKAVPDFIKGTRLERGRQLLSEKAGPVTEIATAVGYSEPSNFVRDFKQYFGYPPGKEKTE